MKILFATSNLNKAREIQALLPAHFEILTLKDIQLDEEIPETSDTIEGNAIQKSEYIVRHFGLNCFADDTGLEIEALNGAPGVKSARYAGEHRSDSDNIAKVLHELKGNSNRNARFKTVISLYLNGEQHLFEGIVEGAIIDSPRGTNGFGYDPIFEPEGLLTTFAEMELSEKNKYSHRARAFAKMIEFLNNE